MRFKKRQINPALFAKNPSGDRRIVVSDFGLAKEMPDGKYSFSIKSKTGLAGTNGWIAPELIRYSDTSNLSPESQTLDKFSRKTVTKAVDIFSLGCVFYYCLTKEHPFGSGWERQSKIIRSDFDISSLIFKLGGDTEEEIEEQRLLQPADQNNNTKIKSILPDVLETPDDNINSSNHDQNNNQTNNANTKSTTLNYRYQYKKQKKVNKAISISKQHSAHHLISCMIANDPKDRPPAEICKNHPFFWEKDKKLQFLIDVSNKIEPYGFGGGVFGENFGF